MHAATKLIKIYFQTASSIPVPLVPFLIFQITELSHVSHYIYIYIYIEEIENLCRVSIEF